MPRAEADISSEECGSVKKSRGAGTQCCASGRPTRWQRGRQRSQRRKLAITCAETRTSGFLATSTRDDPEPPRFFGTHSRRAPALGRSAGRGLSQTLSTGFPIVGSKVELVQMTLRCRSSRTPCQHRAIQTHRTGPR